MQRKDKEQENKLSEGKYYEVIIGNILDAPEDIMIAHQVSSDLRGINMQGLAKEIFTIYPNANVYKKGTTTVGTITVRDRIINMTSQRFPGAPKPKENDSYSNRLEWFQSCLNSIAEIPDITKVALPYNIGCGLARGNWTDYERMINEFASNNRHIKVILYLK